jgi:hypothetical protein
VNGATVSSSASYTFTVTSNVALVARFKPVYTVLTSAEPPDGGQVDADTIFDPGDTARLKAIPSPGYAFVNWTQNGVPVSDETNYQFTVNANRELVANFAPGYRVVVFAEPVNGGGAYGGGVYDVGLDVIVEAVENPGYIFLNWTENGVPVSASPVYSFPSDAAHELVANFIALPTLVTSLAAPGALAVSWPAASHGWALQEKACMDTGDWADTTNTVVVVGNQSQVTVPSGPGTCFFRLVHP